MADPRERIGGSRPELNVLVDLARRTQRVGIVFDFADGQVDSGAQPPVTIT